MPIISKTSFKMSQSDAHRQLVVATATAIQRHHPMIQITTDLLPAPGATVPPLIGGHRPDIVASCHEGYPRFIIAEAKTDGDVDNRHTWSQVSAFVNHLEALTAGSGVFILAVNGHVADTARTVLRFACRRHVSTRLRIKLFDGLDFWSLGSFGEPLWRLS